VADRVYHVYILSNAARMLYVGVTGNLERRTWQHKQKRVRGFTERYNLTQLVYCEAFGEVHLAIAREKQIKGWLRAKKMALIEIRNPKWRDLAADWSPKHKRRSNDWISNRIS
jgi:putative endonuclease